MNSAPGIAGARSGGGVPEFLLGMYGSVWLVTAIHPSDRTTWLFENLLVFAVVPLLICTYRRFRFSNLSYTLIAIFMVLHALGAHFTYSEMPLGNWLRDNWHLTRNHYDRVVHFVFGLLITLPLWEFVRRKFGLSRRWSYLAVFHIVLCWSGLYELLEALVAHLTDPAVGAAYNGTQGDEWDSQKDMALALAGAVICVIAIALFRQQTDLRAALPVRGREQMGYVNQQPIYNVALGACEERRVRKASHEA